MKKILHTTVLLSLALVMVFASACSTQPTPEPEVAEPEIITLYAPESTSSIPLILAVNELDNFEIVLYSNQSQANTLFLRGDVPLLVIGLSVGFDLFENEAPVQIANSYVTGTSYLVTYGKEVKSFAELKGESIYVPFEGSPIEEASIYFTEKEGLDWKTDFTPVYSPFDASVALLKEGKLSAVVLPEPMVSVVRSQEDVYVSLSYYDLWNQNNPGADGYPQVGTMVNTEWAATHAEDIERFNTALAEAITLTQNDPEAAAAAVTEYYKFPEPVLVKALQGTNYQLTTGAKMQEVIENYYEVIGKPLNEKFEAFYYNTSN